ncbi:MAG: hypothetical protein ACT4QF_22815 [Sporichthyaceae bacterium]
MSQPRSSAATRRLRTIALATAGACLVGLLAALQTPTATAAGEPDGASPAGSAPAGWTAQPFDETSVAARTAAESGQRVELESRRGSNTTEYVNPDGSSTVEITQNDTRVEKDGIFVDIDPSLDKQDGVLVPDAAKADVAITDGSGTEPLATVSNGAQSLSLDWIATDLPTARVDGAEATFDAGTDRDVRVTATADGFNINIVLDKVPSAAPVYRLPVTARGLRLVATSGGGFAATDAKGTVVFRIAPPLMWDSSQKNFEAGPEHTVPVDARVVDGADGSQVLELGT